MVRGSNPLFGTICVWFNHFNNYDSMRAYQFLFTLKSRCDPPGSGNRCNCINRGMSASDSERCRPGNPKHVGHRFRSMSATFWWLIGISGRHQSESCGKMWAGKAKQNWLISRNYGKFNSWNEEKNMPQERLAMRCARILPIRGFKIKCRTYFQVGFVRPTIER